MHFTVKICFFDIFQFGCPIKAHKLSFWSLWYQYLYYGMKLQIMWSKLQLFPWCDMQWDARCNASEVKQELKNGVSTTSKFNFYYIVYDAYKITW